MYRAVSLGLGLALLGSAPPVLAHAELLRAMPQHGSVVSTSPAEVRLQFSEGIEGRFSGLDVVAPNGKRIATGRAQIQGWHGDPDHHAIAARCVSRELARPVGGQPQDPGQLYL